MKSFEENDIAYCAVSIDGSSYDGLKLFLVLAQYFVWKNGGIQSKLIDFKSKPNETADTIAGYVRDTLEKSGLSKKYVAFTGDNCSAMFGGLRRNEHGCNVFAILKKTSSTLLVGVGCPARVLNNCIHHGAERMSIDNKNTMNKIYQYLSIYKART